MVSADRVEMLYEATVGQEIALRKQKLQAHEMPRESTLPEEIEMLGRIRASILVHVEKTAPINWSQFENGWKSYCRAHPEESRSDM